MRTSELAAKRIELLGKLEQAKMQETVNDAVESMSATLEIDKPSATGLDASKHVGSVPASQKTGRVPSATSPTQTSDADPGIQTVAASVSSGPTGLTARRTPSTETPVVAHGTATSRCSSARPLPGVASTARTGAGVGVGVGRGVAVGAAEGDATEVGALVGSGAPCSASPPLVHAASEKAATNRVTPRAARRGREGAAMVDQR